MTRGKEPWDKRATGLVDKVGRVIRSLWDILYKIIQQTIETVNYVVRLIIRLVINPTATIFFCLGLLAFVTVITSIQWWQIGVWVGVLTGVPSLMGWGLGLVGMIGGLFINIEELSPELHKIDESLARAYDKMGVKLDHTPEPESLKDRLANWFSYDMALAKKGRLVSYVAESAIVLSYIFMTGLTFQVIIIAVISLICPEIVVKYLASKTSLFGTASALANQIESEGGTTRNFGGSKPAKGGSFEAPGMEFPGGGSGGKKDRF
jgi:hypothetical protein